MDQTLSIKSKTNKPRNSRKFGLGRGGWRLEEGHEGQEPVPEPHSRDDAKSDMHSRHPHGKKIIRLL